MDKLLQGMRTGNAFYLSIILAIHGSRSAPNATVSYRYRVTKTKYCRLQPMIHTGADTRLRMVYALFTFDRILNSTLKSTAYWSRPSAADLMFDPSRHLMFPRLSHLWLSLVPYHIHQTLSTDPFSFSTPCPER